jgi:diguanylate cyclase (GGDEF)-like protein/PAS domain S-box-containing protein
LRGLTLVLCAAVWVGALVVHQLSQANGRYDGSWLLVLTSGLVVTALAMTFLVTASRSERRALERLEVAAAELARQERYFRKLVANSTDLVMVTDRAGKLRYVSPSSWHLLGAADTKLVGVPVRNLVHRDDAPILQDTIGRGIASGSGTVGPVELRMRRGDGTYRWFETVTVNLLEDPDVRGVVWTSADVTERRERGEELAAQATHDALTGLPNRTLLFEQLERALLRNAAADTCTAVLFVDLDRFKVINDSLGHSAGDELLVRVAARLRHAVRPGDTVARFGGDEFVVIAEGVAGVAETRQIADRLAATLAAPFHVLGHEVFVSASVGMTMAAPQDTPETLLRDADTAMYRAKDEGRGRSVLFDEQTRRKALDRLTLENALHHAIDRGEMVMHYQPQVDLESGTFIGLEALLRWQHPIRGLLTPEHFMTMAEDTGLVVAIGEWMLTEVCTQAEQWNRMRNGSGPLLMGVNISARELAEPRLVERVERALERSGLAPESLCIEITEGALMQDVEATVRTLRTLKRIGVKLAIDDFGTGYASLGHLKRFPVDSLKIDRTFVDGLGTDPDDRVIAAAVIGLAHALGVTAVAEGVETDVHVAELRALRCDGAQGWLYGRPADARAIEGSVLKVPGGIRSLLDEH